MGSHLFSRMIAVLIAISLLIAVNAPTCSVAMAEPHSQMSAMTELENAPNLCKACEKNAAQHASCLLFSCLIFIVENQNSQIKPEMQTAFFVIPAHQLFEFRAQLLSPPI